MIPSVDQCLQLMAQYGMLENIKAHSLVVEKVASFLARSLRQRGLSLVLERVSAGALLHDIAKTECLRTKEDHAKKGKEICLYHHFDEIAEIVAEHIILADFDPDLEVQEKEIVYYADKRVNQNTVVPLEKRLEYLLDHYGRDEKPLCDLIQKNFRVCREVERKIFSTLPFHPEEISLLIGRRALADKKGP